MHKCANVVLQLASRNNKCQVKILDCQAKRLDKTIRICYNVCDKIEYPDVFTNVRRINR